MRELIELNNHCHCHWMISSIFY